MKHRFFLIYFLTSSFLSLTMAALGVEKDHAAENLSSQSTAAAKGSSHSEPIKIVAAENFYGGIVQQIGGASVVVTSIITNPNQDPHEFQAGAAVAKAVADADIVIYNGMGYDGWMDKLLSSRGKPGRLVISVAHLITIKTASSSNDNPHLWYDPKTMVALAKELEHTLNKPLELQTFLQQMQPLFDKMISLQKKYPALTVTATEPLFGPMADALGWKMLNIDYQWAIMNGTEPSFQQTMEYENSLKIKKGSKKAALLFYNSQVTNSSTQRMQQLAEQNGIPVLGITEMQPLTFPTYQAWMMAQLSEIEKALAKKNDE